MKILSALALCFLLGGLARAQENAAPAPDSAAVPSAQPKIDPAKEDDIRHLLDVVGTAALARQLMGTMEQSMKPLLANARPPGDYRDQLIDLFFEKYHSKLDTKTLLDLAVVRYDENFSDSEIKALIDFYQTPLGKKMITMLPKNHRRIAAGWPKTRSTGGTRLHA